MIIETARLIIRPFKSSDIQNLVLHLGNINVSRCLLVVPFPYTVADAEWWVGRSCAEWAASVQSAYPFAVEYRESGSLIGGCGLTDVTESSGAVGYWLAEEYHRMGIGSEMLQALIKFSSEQLHLTTLWADAYETNIASQSLLKKCGFEKDDTVAPSLKRCRADGIERTAIRYTRRTRSS